MVLYFLALLPPEDLREKVKEIKLEISRCYGASHALKSPAHITLQMPFRKKESAEQSMEEALSGFSEKCKPFYIELGGFDFFPPKVIFIRISDHRPLVALRNNLLPVLWERLELTKKQTGNRFHPHLTVATRDLKDEAFPVAREDFSGREFSSGFEVKSLYLLKHNGKNWDIFKEFPFS
ncbi:MAG: 2'-5' RNA ligase family protein [Saprospirales bacterium]|nr:MAG: 2'-5' RNA ligase family protein [Saprospirales bacterium]